MKLLLASYSFIFFRNKIDLCSFFFFKLSFFFIFFYQLLVILNCYFRSNLCCHFFSHDDPLDGVPFKVTLNLSEEAPETSLSEAIAIVTRMEATDWDDYDYNFKLEQSVLDECNNKILVRNESWNASPWISLWNFWDLRSYKKRIFSFSILCIFWCRIRIWRPFWSLAPRFWVIKIMY